MEARYREAERRLWESVGVVPSERRIELPRAGISVRVQEVGTGPTVLFIHGTTNCGASWAPLVAGLDGFRRVVLDRPGCGLSEPLPRPFENVAELEAYADELVGDVLDGIGLPAAAVVSTSLGGYFAFRSTAANPDRVTSLVHIAWTVGAPTGTLPFVMRVGALPGLGRVMAAVPPTRGAVRAMLRQIGLGQALDAGRVSDELIEWFVAMLRHTDTMRNELRAGPPVPHPWGDPMGHFLLPTSLLARIATPVAFLWGEEDPFGGATTATEFSAHVPDAELTIMPGAGHAPWLDDTDFVVDTTREFLDR